MTIIDQLKQFDQLRGKDPIDPTVIQEGPGDVPMIDPTPRNPDVPPEWLDDPEDIDYVPTQAPPSPLIPRTSPDAPRTPQTEPARNLEQPPDLLVIARGKVCAAAYKGKDVVLSEAGQKAVARIVLSEIMAGLKAEMGAVGIKRVRGPRKKASTFGHLGEKLMSPPKKRGRPKKVKPENPDEA